MLANIRSGQFSWPAKVRRYFRARSDIMRAKKQYVNPSHACFQTEAFLRTLCDPQEISAELKDLINGMLKCASTLAPPSPPHARADIIRNARKEFMRKYQPCMFFQVTRAHHCGIWAGWIQRSDSPLRRLWDILGWAAGAAERRCTPRQCHRYVSVLQSKNSMHD
eukprot:COSAG05_NODE_106_length_18750_cov_677.083105_5_plen_165_part_00